MSSNEVQDPAFRQRLQFSREGNVLRVRIWTDPGGGVPAHYHPSLEERWHVVEGRLRFKIDGRTVEAIAGETITARPGVRHAFTNVGDEVAITETEVEPAGRMQEFLEQATELSRAGKYNRRGIPTSLSGLIAASDLALRHRDDIVLTSFPLPPPKLQPIMFKPLARLA